MAQLNFDANTVDPNQAYDPVPAGWYPVQITESEMKPTSNGSGAYLQLEMTILDGAFKGRKIFDRLNLQNQNTTTVEIAYKTLSAICHATNIIQVQDSSQLHGIPMEAKVVVRPAQNGYDASNDVKGYRAVGSGNGAAAPGAPAGQAPVGMPPQAPAQAPAMAPPAQAPAQPAGMPPAQPAAAPPAQAPAQAPVQQTPAAAPATQAPPAAWGQQPAAPAQAPAQAPAGHPTQGAAPSAAAPAGAPPWGAPAQ